MRLIRAFVLAVCLLMAYAHPAHAHPPGPIRERRVVQYEAALGRVIVEYQLVCPSGRQVERGYAGRLRCP